MVIKMVLTDEFDNLLKDERVVNRIEQFRQSIKYDKVTLPSNILIAINNLQIDIEDIKNLKKGNKDE